MDELVRNNLPYLAQKTIEGGRHIKSRPRYFWPQFYFGLGVHEKTRSQVWDVADSLDFVARVAESMALTRKELRPGRYVKRAVTAPIKIIPFRDGGHARV
jgi:hypothetical protein